MAGKEITDLKEITTLLNQASDSRAKVHLKMGRFKKIEGFHSRLVRNAVQVYLPQEEMAGKIGQPVEVTSFFPPVTGRITFASDIAAEEPNTRPPDGVTVDLEVMSAFLLTPPQKVVLEDVRSFPRHKFGGVVPIKAKIFKAGQMPSPKDIGRKREADGESGKDEGRHFIARVLDVSQGGLKVLYPLSTESMHVLKDSQSLDLTFTVMGISYRSGAEVIEVKENAKARKGLLRVIFNNMPEEDSKRLGRYVTHKLEEEKEKAFKRIVEKQISERKIINPKTLRDEMTAEELESIKWRKKGDIYLVQVDKLTKGKKAFVIYLLKRGSKDTYIKKEWSGEAK